MWLKNTKCKKDKNITNRNVEEKLVCKIDVRLPKVCH